MTPRFLTGALITVALITTAGCGSNGNTPATDSARPAVAAAPAAPPDCKYLLERVDDAAVVQLYADGFSALPLRPEGPHLAPLRSGPRRSRHLLRSAVRARPRDARRPRGDHHAPDGVDPADASPRFSATRSSSGSTPGLQQPDGAEVRPEVHAGGLCEAARAAARAGAKFPRRTARPSTRCSPACSRCSSTPTSTRSSPTRHRGTAGTS